MANGVPKRSLIREIKRLAREVTIDDLQLAWSRSAAKGLGLMILDRRYLAVPEETWRKVLQYSGVDSVPYRAESRDCDLEVDFVEPQTDRIISQDPESPYAMRAGTAIF